MLDQNEMEEKSIRDKIHLYFSKRQGNNTETESVEDAMFDEDSSYNNDRSDVRKRQPAGVRVTTRRGVSNKAKPSKGIAQTYMSEPVPRKPAKKERSTTPE